MNQVELRTYTPELGLFVITGMEDEVKPLQRAWHARSVSESTFDRAVYGKSTKSHAKSLQLGRLSLSLS